MAEELIIKVKAAGADQVDRELKKVDQSVKDLGVRTKKEVSAFAVATGAVLAQGITSGISKVGSLLSESVGSFFAFDDQLANVRKTVGLTKDELTSFGDEILKLSGDTRTSITELLDIATIGGQMGIAKDQIVDFTFAIDKLNVALGDEFTGGAEEITREMGSIINVFKLAEREGGSVSDAITKLGSGINELGSAGLATGPWLTDFTRRVGNIAPLIGVSVEQTLGLGAALQELGQSSEVAGTSIQMIFTAMGKDPAEFAKLAGKSAEEFSQILRDDAFSALLLVADAVKTGGTDLETLSKTLDTLGIDGSRAVGVLGNLAGNTGLVTEKVGLMTTAYAEGTSALNEFNIKNETGQAELDKLGNKFETLKIKIGEALAPTLLKGVDALTQLVSGETAEDFANVLYSRERENAMTGAGDMGRVLGGQDMYGRFAQALTGRGDPLGTLRLDPKTNNDWEVFRDLLIDSNISFEKLDKISDQSLRKMANESKNVNEWVTKVKIQLAGLGDTSIPINRATGSVNDLQNKILLLTNNMSLAMRLAPQFGSAMLAAQSGNTSAANALEIARTTMRNAGYTPNFALGGIVPGNLTSGDKVVARVNSGEMILTKDQQSGLFGMLKKLSSGNTNNFNAPINFGSNGQMQDFNLFSDILKRV